MHKVNKVCRAEAYTELLEAVHSAGLHQVELGGAGKRLSLPQNVLTILQYHRLLGTSLLQLNSKHTTIVCYCWNYVTSWLES